MRRGALDLCVDCGQVVAGLGVAFGGLARTCACKCHKLAPDQRSSPPLLLLSPQIEPVALPEPFAQLARGQQQRRLSGLGASGGGRTGSSHTGARRGHPARQHTQQLRHLQGQAERAHDLSAALGVVPQRAAAQRGRSMAQRTAHRDSRRLHDEPVTPQERGQLEANALLEATLGGRLKGREEGITWKMQVALLCAQPDSSQCVWRALSTGTGIACMLFHHQIPFINGYLKVPAPLSCYAAAQGEQAGQAQQALRSRSMEAPLSMLSAVGAAPRPVGAYSRCLAAMRAALLLPSRSEHRGPPHSSACRTLPRPLLRWHSRCPTLCLRGSASTLAHAETSEPEPKCKPLKLLTCPAAGGPRRRDCQAGPLLRVRAHHARLLLHQRCGARRAQRGSSAQRRHGVHARAPAVLHVCGANAGTSPAPAPTLCAASIFAGYQIDRRVFVNWGQYTVVGDPAGVAGCWAGGSVVCKWLLAQGNPGRACVTSGS